MCPQVLTKFTAFQTRGGVCPQIPNKVYSVSTRGGVPTAPKKVYSVSNKGRRVPTDPNKVYSVSTRGGVPTAPKKVYSVSGGDASGAGPGTIRMWRQSPTENFSRTLRSSDNGIIGCRGLTKFTAFLTRGGVPTHHKKVYSVSNG